MHDCECDCVWAASQGLEAHLGIGGPDAPSPPQGVSRVLASLPPGEAGAPSSPLSFGLRTGSLCSLVIFKKQFAHHFSGIWGSQLSDGVQSALCSQKRPAWHSAQRGRVWGVSGSPLDGGGQRSPSLAWGSGAEAVHSAQAV